MRTQLVLLAIGAGAGSLAGQGSTALYTRWNALGGFEFQRYGFSDSVGANGVTSVSQWSIPFVVVAPIGRQMSVDLTTHIAHNSVTGSTTQTYTGLTDTQLRLLYTLGRDRAVASLSINLPTGKHSFPTSEFAVSSSMSSPYLSFPVSSLGTGFAVTGGLAYAIPTGGWNLGFAGSVRYASSYEPFSDQPVTYSPGLEGRLRLGADRLIGQRARLLLGATFSTFSTDQFSGSGLVSGWFNPGPRFIGDVGYSYTWGRTTLGLGIWDFYRAAGSDGSSPSVDTKENVFNAELRVGHQLSPRLVLEPLVAFRQWSPGSVSGGRLFTFGANARIGLNDQFSATASARFGPGWVYDPTPGRSGKTDLTATGVSVLVRYQR
jgi:hypothetical protein